MGWVNSGSRLQPQPSGLGVRANSTSEAASESRLPRVRRRWPQTELAPPRARRRPRQGRQRSRVGSRGIEDQENDTERAVELHACNPLRAGTISSRRCNRPQRRKSMTPSTIGTSKAYWTVGVLDAGWYQPRTAVTSATTNQVMSSKADVQ